MFKSPIRGGAFSSPAQLFTFTAPVCSLVFVMTASAQLAPTHRYSFTNDASDSIGDAHATLMGSATVADGKLVLPGGNPRTNYAVLPESLGEEIATYNAVTFECWFSTDQVQNWSKLFYFGEPDGSRAIESLEFTPVKGDGSGLGKAESLNDDVASSCHTTATFSELNTPIHVVVVFDGDNGVITVYKNGVFDSEASLNHTLADLYLPQLYLGAAVGWNDRDYYGKIDEFRIYNFAFTPDNVAASFASGPDELADDADNDGLPDAWEKQHNVSDPNGDEDGDGLNNLGEYRRGTDPNNPDTDGDGLSDLVETNTGVWVSATDTGTNPLVADTDQDGLLDGVETNTGVFVDANNTGTNPHQRDTDGDMVGDATEVIMGSNPNLSTSRPTPKLVHRYSFNETSGRKVTDSVSGAHGHVHGKGFEWGNGALTLYGGSPNLNAAYVSLPAHMISNHGQKKNGTGSFTIEGWATVIDIDGGVWARLVDFGVSEPGGANGAIFGAGNWNGGGTSGTDSFFVTAYNGSDAGAREVTLRKNDEPVRPEVRLDNLSATNFLGEMFHFAVTFDESSGVLHYYENGEWVTSKETDPTQPIKLDNFLDLNCWLGRSNYTVDGNLHGSFHELRIYNGALSDTEVTAHFTAGPDGAPGEAVVDSDGDGMADWFERAYGLNPNDPADASQDADNDGLTNLQEFQRGSSPLKPDTDGDGLPDAVETNTGIFVSATDTGTSPIAYDSDGDFQSDRAEVLNGSNPVDSASVAVPLQHRWSFNDPAQPYIEPGTATIDSVTGEANAIIRGNDAAFTGSGVALPGGPSSHAAYIDLPNRLISPLHAVTLEMWVSVDATGYNWARFFDFGNVRDAGDPSQGIELNDIGGSGEGGDYLVFIAAVGSDYNTNRLELREATPGPVVTTELNFGIGTLEEGAPIHYVVMVDSSVPGVSRGSVWRNGSPIFVNLPMAGNLSNVDDVNNWLGRSNWTADSNLAGTYDEFRIFGGLLDPDQIRDSYEAGPDADLSGPPPATIGFEIISVGIADGGNVSLTFPTESGKTYQVETSTTLSGWTPLGPAIAGTGNPATFMDTANGAPATTGGQRFYRVRVVTP